MRKLNSLIAAAAMLLVGTGTFADDNDLFSDFQSGAVFGSPSDSGARSRPATPKRIRTVQKLRDVVADAGFEAKILGSRGVTAKKELSPWTFPVLLVLSEDEKTIDVILGLTTVKDAAKELPAVTLLKLMSLSQKHAPAMFAYHANRERTELSLTLKNSDVTGQTLRDEINRLAVIARKTSADWAGERATGNADQTTQGPTTPRVSRTSVAGKWSASKSATEAFGVEFLGDGRFNLIYVNGSKQTKSSGTFTVGEGKLRLAGSNGLKLEGTMNVRSATEFQFTPANGSPLTFKKATP